MNVLGISGSLRKNSYNSLLIKAYAQYGAPAISVNTFDELADIPAFDEDIRETPEAVDTLRRQLKEASAVIVSTPEYAHGVPGALKNVLDWLVSFEEIILKPIAVMSVSTSALGGYRAHAALITTLNAMNTRLVIDASINIPFAKSKFDEQGNLIDDLIVDRVRNSSKILHKYLLDNA